MALRLNYEDCLSKLRLETSPGLATFAALFLLATGGISTAWTLLSYTRALFSLFVLPGKSVITHLSYPSSKPLKQYNSSENSVLRAAGHSSLGHRTVSERNTLSSLLKLDSTLS